MSNGCEQALVCGGVVVSAGQVKVPRIGHFTRHDLVQGIEQPSVRD